MPKLSDYSKILGKAAKNRYTTTALFIFVGILVGFIGIPSIPAIGLPGITTFWIGVALVLYGFYQFLPAAGQILDKARKGRNWKCPYALAPGTPITPAMKYCTQATPDTRWLSMDNAPTCTGPLNFGGNHEKVKKVAAETQVFMDQSVFGLLYTRSFLKILAISFVALEFSPLSFDNFPFKNIILIPLVFLFAVYFQMPTGYKKNQPYKAVEAWYRMLVGFVIALLMMSFLTPNPSAAFQGLFWTQFILLFAAIMILAFLGVVMKSVIKNITIVAGVLAIIFLLAVPILGSIAGAAFNMPAVAVFYLILAFFATMPQRRTEEEGEEKTVISIRFQAARNFSQRLDQFQEDWENFGKIVFLAFALAGGIPIFTWATLGASLKVAYAIVWVLAIAMGWLGGREGRPYIGTVVIVMTVIAFSFAFSSTVGTAVFGAYWGTIEHTGETFFGPIGQQLDRASCDAYANYQCITAGPIECNRLKLECQRKTSEAQGSDKSIDITSFVAAPKEIGLDTNKKIPNTTVYVTIENTGDYEAQDVDVKVLGKAQGYPKVPYVQNVQTFKQIGDTEVLSCTGGDYLGENTCEWKGNFRTGSKGVVNFVIDWTKGEDQLPGYGSSIWNYYYGQYPQIAISTSFNYHVESRYDATVRSSGEMASLLQSGTDIAGAVSVYTGGPMAASLWMPQYVETGKTTFLTAALTNNKEGTATAASYCIYIPAWAGVPTYSSGGYKAGAPDCEPVADTNAVECYWDQIKPVTAYDQTTMKPQNYGECVFRLTPDSGGVPEKQLSVTGKATFHYEVTNIRKDIPIVG